MRKIGKEKEYNGRLHNIFKSTFEMIGETFNFKFTNYLSMIFKNMVE